MSRKPTHSTKSCLADLAVTASTAWEQVMSVPSENKFGI